ncbi:hypothetical protein [Streptomyces niveus]
MKSTRLERRAEKLQLATGVTWTDALKRVRSVRPGVPLIPEAHTSQAVLESYVLSGLAWPMVDTHNPWGIRSVEARTDSLALTFENDIVQPDDSESMARELVRALVPCSDKHGEVHGIPGVRFTADDGGIHFQRIGLPGSLTVLGVPPEEWDTALVLQRRENESDGKRFCHDGSPHRWDRGEAAFRAPTTRTVLGRHHFRKRPSAWLASGLLRRAPLFRTIGVPLSTTAWTNLTDDGGSEWIIEYINEPLADAPCYHQGFTDLLTDPECGLTVTGTIPECSCNLASESYFGCRFYARSSIGQPGALQVRFSRRSGERARSCSDGLNDYEARRNLYRPLPEYLVRSRAGTGC